MCPKISAVVTLLSAASVVGRTWCSLATIRQTSQTIDEYESAGSGYRHHLGSKKLMYKAGEETRSMEGSFHVEDIANSL